MSYRDRVLRQALEKAASLRVASAPPQLASNGVWFHDDDTIPQINAVIACQGGGSWAIGVAEALKSAIAEVLAQGGKIAAIGGTSGGAIAAAAAVKGLNEGYGVAGVAAYSDEIWDQVKASGAVFGMSRFKNPFPLSPEDAWPNIPQIYLTLSEIFNYGQPGFTTQLIRDMVNKGIGDWDSVRNGPTALQVNTVRQNIYTGQREHYIFTGQECSGDAVAASAGLRELGGHIILDDMGKVSNWANRKLYRYFDGAEVVNPSVESLLRYNPTDVIVISLHGAPGTPKSTREKKLYTDEIHYDLTDMQLDDGRRFHLHELALRLPKEWNSTSRLNTDPAFLERVQSMCREQAEAWRLQIRDSLGRESTYRPQASVVEKMVAKRELVA